MSTHANRRNTAHRKTLRVRARPPFECIALVLQRGGALGAYQASGPVAGSKQWMSFLVGVAQFNRELVMAS